LVSMSESPAQVLWQRYEAGQARKGCELRFCVIIKENLEQRMRFLRFQIGLSSCGTAVSPDQRRQPAQENLTFFRQRHPIIMEDNYSMLERREKKTARIGLGGVRFEVY